ncbi:hypothetical protein [Actinokineospora iranica]|uniref:Uncharacterized protein n=1 Tax=Actinokineospora iranica TaxID=1271860 RepID=A0A1G6U886_9PSEU|nr:hypothetical protein [Actinokineospora iranica]SDD37568.1 hypothetical protein SAMN05216174_110158 [Actinokineospora iranica]
MGVLGDPPFEFTSYFWAGTVFEDALTRAGLLDLTRHKTVAPQDDRPPGFWDLLLRNPSFAVFSARNPT